MTISSDENTNLFAIDIGTRKVMGLVAQASGESVRVLDAETIEHRTRAMSAGQVQDVGRVAEVVRAVADKLSRRVGPLGKAAVAVAGRNLKTHTGKGKFQLQYGQRLSAADVEWTVQLALQDALEALRQGGAPAGAHHCAGYAVVRQTLDGDPMSHPIGHMGTLLEIEVLATFLPRRVLDSLFAVLDEAGIEPACVTLEPIAALQAAVPPSMRRFDLALVDIGAGTSDIAVVRGGLVRAFGMVPQAGDFITERLSDMLLVDFFEAERLKRLLGCDARVEGKDIFERPVSFFAPEARQRLEPALRELAAAIAGPLKDLCGGQAPQTVICVGGGSQTPGLMDALADALDIDRQRVGTRAPRGMAEASLETPQAATPFGIALVARDRSGLRFRRIDLNGSPLYLMESGKPVDVLSALKAAGVPPERIYGKPGPARTFRVDGELRWAKGTAGVPGRVTLNGRLCTLETHLVEGDKLSFEPGQSGEEGRVTVAQAIGWNGQGAAPKVLLNDLETSLDADVPDRAALIVLAPELPLEPVSDVLAAEAPLAELPAEAEFSAEEAEAPAAAWLQPAQRPLQVVVNGAPVLLHRPPRQGSPAMLFDVLSHAGLMPLPGKRLKLLINGEKAGFTSPIHDGAEVHASFE